MSAIRLIERLEPRRLLAAVPVAHWPFEEGVGGATADHSGNGNVGTLQNGAVFGQGLIARYSMAFNEAGYVEVPNAASLNPTSALTVSAWINPTNWTGNRRVLQKGNNDNQYRLGAEDGQFIFEIEGLATAATALPSTAAWHHVAGSYDGAAVSLYVDGALAATAAASGAIPTTSNPLFIGTKNASASAADRFVGRIDDVRLYDEALSAVEIANLANIININFQPPSAATPAKYLVDAGNMFAVRGNGYSYGWNFSHTDVMRDRNVNSDQRLDTLAHFHFNGVWEIALPNGPYEVIASIGDPSFASTHTLNVEGVSFASAVPLGANVFQTIRRSVNVTDGRLSIDQGAAPEMATRINYVQILGLDPQPNTAPNTPTITEPTVDGQIVNPADVHMEAPNFSDPDPGDVHASSDWEIRLGATNELVWQAPGASGVEKVHIHLGDGEFVGSHAAFTELLPTTDYLLRARHRDNRGAVSAYATRQFTTSARTTAIPLSLGDVLPTPAPSWVNHSGGGAVELPVGTSMTLGGPGGEVLLMFDGLAGTGNIITNPPALGAHINARIRFTATSASLSLPQTNLTFTEDSGASHTVYLPSVSLPTGQSAYFWVGADGSSYVATAKQTEPNFDTPARLAPIPFTPTQSGYTIDVFASNFQLPVNIAFVPNPGPNPNDVFFYVTELYGNIKVVTRDGTVGNYATNLLNFNPTGNFPGSGEQGLSGIVVDPATGDVFATMVYSSVPGVETAPHYPKVVRFTSTDGGRTAATQTTILDMPGETMGQSHFISNLTIGPADGKLYVHVGDGFNTATAQNLDSFRGKILRMNLDGSAATDNPFYNAANGINARDYVYAYGFRNPFGGGWRDADGKHYEVENGPNVDRLAQVVAGRNYLWDGSNASMQNFAIYNWNPSHAPVNLMFIQNSVFGGSGFPASKLDHLFISESGPTYATGPQTTGKKITEFTLDASGNLISGPTNFLTYSGSGKGTVVALAAGPDGIYFSELYKDQNYNTPIDRGARIFRVSFIDTVPPTVSNPDYLYLTSPTKLTMQFSENVSTSLSLADIEVQNLTTPGTFNPTSLSYDFATNTATFTFPDGAPPDGDYRATLFAAGVTDPAGNPLTQDLVFDFFFLNGDANHDGTVNLPDFNILAANFAASGANFAQGDFNYDTVVNLLDFDILASRFGMSVAPATIASSSLFGDRRIGASDDQRDEVAALLA